MNDPYPPPTGADAKLCDQIANGLHALAQPLTVLRGAVGVLTGPGAKERDQRRYLEMSASQIEGICDLLSQMQMLVDSHQFEANPVTVDLDMLIGRVLEDTETLLHRAGIELVVENPERGLAIVADYERTTQAIRSTLKTFASVSSPGDVIRLWILPQDNFVEFAIENQKSGGRSFNSSERFSLSMAEVCVRSQRGSYCWGENPVRVTLKMPIQNRTGNNNRAENCDSLRREAIARLPMICIGSGSQNFSSQESSDI